MQVEIDRLTKKFYYNFIRFMVKKVKSCMGMVLEEIKYHDW